MLLDPQNTLLLPRRAEMATDFAVSEECNHYDECDDYLATYGDAVLMIEYSDADFANYPQISIVRRDLDLTVPGDGNTIDPRARPRTPRPAR